MKQDFSQIHQMSSHSPAQTQAQVSTPDPGTHLVQVPESRCACVLPAMTNSVASGVCVREGMGATLLGVDYKLGIMGFGLSCKAFLCPRWGETVGVCLWLLKQWKREARV